MKYGYGISIVGTMVALLVCSFPGSSDAWSTGTGASTRTRTLQTKRSVMSMKRGRGSLGEIKDSGGLGGSKGSSGGASSAGGGGGGGGGPTGKWMPIQGRTSGIKDFDLQDGKVILVDTMAPPITNSATNPKGSVSVVKYGPSIYCTSVGCASCQIPLNKATVLEPNEDTGGKDPRLSCSFCRATYNLRTGTRVAAANGGGIMSGMVKNLFSATEETPLPIYALGEKNGQVLINLGAAADLD